MQLSIQIHLEESLILPLSYHHIVQAALYNLMIEEEQDRSFYHKSASRYGKREYRLFTFGLLRGNYHIKDQKIYFKDEVYFEVRSADMHCIHLINHNILTNGIRFGRTLCHDVETQIRDFEIEDDVVTIQMDSPICVYMTDYATRKKIFWEPDQDKFSEYVEENFMRKYTAAYGISPESGIRIVPIEISMKDKYVTKYKNSYISGWKGIYRLEGKRKYLNFLYQTGIGSKNSQGFGMFDVIDFHGKMWSTSEKSGNI